MKIQFETQEEKQRFEDALTFGQHSAADISIANEALKQFMRANNRVWQRWRIQLQNSGLAVTLLDPITEGAPPNP